MSNMVNVLSTKVLSTVATVATVASGVSGLQMHFDEEAEEKLQSRQRHPNPNGSNPSKWRWEDRVLCAAPNSKAPVKFEPTREAPEWHVRLQGPHYTDFGAGTLHHLRTKNSAEESLVISSVVHNLDDNSHQGPRRDAPTSYKFDKETKIIHVETDYPIATLEMKPNDNTVKVTCGNFTKTPSFDDTVMFDRQYFLEDGKHHHEFDVMFITLPKECKKRAEEHLEARNSDPKRQWTLPLMDPSELEQGREVECKTTDAKKALDGARPKADMWTKAQGWPAIGEKEFGQFLFGFTVPEGEAFDRTFAREAQADVLNANIHSFTATEDDNGKEIKGDNPGVNGDLSYPGRNLFYFGHDVGFRGYSGGGYACRYAANDATGDAAGDWFMWSVHQSGNSPERDESGIYSAGSSMSVLVKRAWERLSKKGGVHASIVDRIARALRRDGHLRADAPPIRFEDWFSNLSEHTYDREKREKHNEAKGGFFHKGFFRTIKGSFGWRKPVTEKLADLHTRTAIIHQLYVKPLKAYFLKPRSENTPLNRQLRNLLRTAVAFEEQHRICQKMVSLAANRGEDGLWGNLFRVDNACPIRVWIKLRESKKTESDEAK